MLLISGALAGCRSVQTSSRIEDFGQNNTASTNIVEKDIKTPEKILFKGKNITIIEKEQSIFKQLPFDSGKKSCLNKSDETIKKKLSALNFNGDDEYLEFETIQTYNSGPDKFTVSFNKDLFSKINADSLKKLDQYVGFTITRNLYFIKDGKIGYLLLIGHESAGSGLGLNYMAHLLVPLDSDKPTIVFQSISDNPRKVKLSDSGAIHYVQFDLDNNSMKDQTSKQVPLTVSLFTIDSGNNKSLETKFGLECENIDSIFPTH